MYITHNVEFVENTSGEHIMETNIENGVINAIRAVINQGEPSYIGVFCVYRCENGAKCVIGHMIDDSFYNTNIEGEGVDSNFVVDIIKSQYPDFTYDESRILIELQRCHDNYRTLKGNKFVSSFTNEIDYMINIGKLPKYCRNGLVQTENI